MGAGLSVMPDGARASAHQRTQSEQPLKRSAGSQRTGLASTSERSSPQELEKFAAAQQQQQHFLAEAFLRFQCVERKQGEREIGLHARKSGKAESGSPSEGLAMEQLVLLRNGRIRIDLDRFDGARTRDQEVTATRRTKSQDPHP